MKLKAPLISVILCTRDRPESFQRALASVLAQDVDDYEVIVVDGSEPAVEIADRAGVPIRVVRDERPGEGRARRAGVRTARGEFIAWCDDDDEWTTDHLRLLRDALLAHPEMALVCASDPPADRSPDNRPRRAASPFGFTIRASDVLHRADAIRRTGGFDPSLRANAAGDLSARMIAVGGCRRVDAVLTRHHRVAGPTTTEMHSKALQRLHGEWRGDAQRRAETARWIAAREQSPERFEPDTWRAGRRELIFQTIMEASLSFSIVAWELIRALKALGVQVAAGPRARDVVPAAWRDIAGPIEPQNRLAFVYEPPVDGTVLRCERVVRYAMWETTIIPPTLVENLNRTLTMLYVPCRDNVRIARDNGVDLPTRILHHGIDPLRFPLLDRPRRGDEPFVFGCHSVLQHRKGTDLLIRAFREEFAPEEPVRLALKHALDRCHDYAPTDPRITLTTGFIDHAGLLSFLRGLDAYVLPSRGEGFGLTGLEAIATGLPLIATDWSGPSEYLDPADTYPLRYQLRETGGIWFGFRRQWGSWAEPDIDHLRELMRYVYEHRDEAAAAGLRAANRAHRDWTWERVARQLVADFDQLARGVTPASTPV